MSTSDEGKKKHHAHKNIENDEEHVKKSGQSFRRLNFATGIVGLLAIGFNIGSLAVHIVYSTETQVYVASVFSIIVIILSIIWLFVDAFILLHEGGNATRLYTKFLSNDPYRFRRGLTMFLLFLNLLSVIVAVVELTGESNTVGGLQSDTGLRKHEASVTVVDSLCVVFDTIFCMLVCQLTFWPVFRAARSALLMCGVLQFVIGTLIIVLNYQSSLTGLYPKRHNMFSFFQHVGSLQVAISVVSIALSSIVNEDERLNKVIFKFVSFYHIFSALCMILSIVFFALTLRILAVDDPKSTNSSEEDQDVSDILHSNPPLAAATICLHILTMLSASKLQKTPPSYLAVEEIDLNKLTGRQFDAFASLIETYGRNYAGAPGGKEAMSLMRAYSNIKDKAISCVVLRIYQPGEDHYLYHHDILRRWAAKNDEHGPPKTYKEIKAWRNLDSGLAINVDDEEADAETVTSEKNQLIQQHQQQQQQPQQLSKNQIKRMQKKNAKKGKKTKEECVEFPLENPKSEEEIQREIEFNAKLMATEALVLLTRVESYDLTATIPGKFGEFLQNTLGENSKLKLLCVRMGLLGFHWPFRQSTFYCSKSRRPIARSAAVLRAITEWNRKLPKRKRCTLYLDPKYERDLDELAIRPSGWNEIRLPPSHIIDLRPYKGKTMYEYLKAIKYRNQDAAFKRAEGQVIEIPNFDSNHDEECSEIIRLWEKIAEKRTGEGHTAVLANPTAEIIRTLGQSEENSNNHSYRTLLFLKIDGTNVASCVLFRLGSTITSDLQGLDHDLAKQYKAYFVMMQETIRIALEEGFSFVDFGPTTSEAKLHIGAKSVPLKGGMHANSWFLNQVIRLAAKNVNSG